MHKLAVVLIVGVFVIGLLIAGCGGGSGNGGSSATGAEGAASTANAESEGAESEGAESGESSESGEGGEESEGGGSTEAASPEKSAFTKKAEVICLKNNTKTAAELVHAYKKAEAEGVNTEPEGLKLEETVILPILVANAEAQKNGIGSLAPPSGDEAQIKAILDAYQAWIDEAKANPKKTSRAGETYEKARVLAGKYPLVKCGLSPFEAVG